ncbi:MAG TPA: IclR family transcriptional regulator [Acidobacteriota bacterium]|nr:IclR family transcriptional regulator [Acidobacteriota bacterium]
MLETKTRKPGILVLHKTFDILETIRESRAGLGLADLARALNLPKPTAYRIAATLEARGYLARNQAGLYQMTRKLFELERKESDEQLLADVAQPAMEHLLEICKETLNLGILDAGEVVVISTIESPQTIRMSSKIGNRRYLHSTALGKILLSGLSDKEVLRLIRLKKLPRLTPNTLITKQAVLAEVMLVRKQGWAMDNEENEPGGRCIAAPITGPGGRVVSALSISAPIFRMDMARARGLVGDLTSACRDISRAFTARA